MERRKTEHIRICLEKEVGGVGISGGWEKYRFWHNALPEIRFEEIDTGSAFLGKSLRVPFIVSSMTGGTRQAWEINRILAETAERRGWAMGVGSVRAAVENVNTAYSFRVRDIAPTIPIFANLGAVQLNYGYGAEECQRAVELVEADGLVLHLNSMQEIFQPEGDTDFRHLAGKIREVCRSLSVPVGVKEVGWGISGEAALRLADAGVEFIDVAGAGGTSWSQVEKYRSAKGIRRLAADTFAGWGIPAADSVREVHSLLPHMPLIASGGIDSGLTAAKAIALGADTAAFGRVLLAPAVDSMEALDLVMQQLEFELAAAMFGIGAGSLAELKGSSALRLVQG
ncbi:type 2 isopentenyl-diphosphate Delta-isomerase [Paenibacillus sp. y28]|uniref:type 2 isopentenyl-diphosphate Delta-isomerase n=1 Tax=Paenibacillus sp. y28 TaxID=3129110 RepID=UPI0030198417